MIPLREVVIRFLLACIALNMKLTLYPLAKFWGYRRFEPQPDTVLVTCAAVCKPRRLRLRPGSPEASLSARQCLGLPGASASLGQAAGWAASMLTGHAGLGLHTGAAPTGWVTSTRWSACWACCRRRA